MAKLDAFTLAYIECMLWSSNSNTNPGRDDESLSDAGFDVDCFAPDALEHVRADCEAFQRQFADLIADDEQAGHDFWLDRVGAGTGALDRKCECDEKHLPCHCPLNVLRHAAAKFYGHLDCYIGDDDLIYLTPDPLSAIKHARRLDARECALVDAYLAKGELPTA